MKIPFILLTLFRENHAQETCLENLECQDVLLTATLLEACTESATGEAARNFERTDFFITSNESEEANLDGMNAACQWKSDSDSLTIKLGECVDPSVADSNAVVEANDEGGSDIVYTYYIHHKRPVNGIDISMVSTQKVQCKIANTLTEDYNVADVENELLEKASNVEWSDADIELDIDAPDGFNVGDTATMKMRFVKTDFTDLFSFAYKKCDIYPGTETVSETSDKQLTILGNEKDFCASAGFEDIVTAPGELDGVKSFQNFDFTVFKFPGNDKVTFSCTVSIFLQAGETAPDPDTACSELVRRKRENSGKIEQQVALSKTIEVKAAKPRVTKGVTVKLENNEKSSGYQFSFSFAVFAVILSMIF